MSRDTLELVGRWLVSIFLKLVLARSVLLGALPPVPKVKEAPRNMDITGLGAGHVDLGEYRATQTAPRQLPLSH